MAKVYRDKRLWIGICVSLIFLVILFKKIDSRQLITAFRAMDWYYLLPAIAFTYLSYYFRAVRWKYLLAPLKTTSMRHLFAATIIGYMANNLLPARLGEFVRAYTLADKEQLDTSAVFATLVLDRLFDGFTVLVFLVATLFTIKFPYGSEAVQRGLVAGGYATLGLYLLVILFLVMLKRYTVQTLRFVAAMLKPFPERLSAKIIPLLGSFIQGIRLSSRTGDLLALALSSLVIWVLAVVPVYLMLHAFGLQLPVSVSVFILVLLVFAVMVPASPGYVGTYHAACVYGLLAFSVPKETALSVALMVHAVNFFPVILLGACYLWRDKLSLARISDGAGHTEDEPTADLSK